MNETKPPVLTIKMVPVGVDLVLMALSKLPHEQVADLFAEIRGQAMQQMEELKAENDAPVETD
jgi:hypothetical protein